MLKISLSIVFCLLVFTTNNFAQACGGGFYQIELNTKDSVNYKLFRITPKDTSYSDTKTQKLIGEIFFPNENKTGWFWNSPVKVENSIAEKFLGNYDAEKYEPIYRDLQSSGDSKTGVIKIITAEAYSAPFLLKLTSQNFKTDYYIGSFLGGCETFEKINLEPKS
ncbi:MAG: hypothetical protein WA584_18190 [Pyrinomonadaceae bacterium]